MVFEVLLVHLCHKPTTTKTIFRMEIKRNQAQKKPFFVIRST